MKYWCRGTSHKSKSLNKLISIPPREKSWLPSSARWRWVGRAPVRTLSPPLCISLLPQCFRSTPLLRPATSWLQRVSLCHLHLATSLPLDTPILHLHHLLHPSLSCRLHHPHKATCSPLHLNRYAVFHRLWCNHNFTGQLKCTSGNFTLHTCRFSLFCKTLCML